MTSFRERLSVGEQHEQRVKRELEERGWIVAQWGQGILPEPIRQALQGSGSRFRHFPDLIASRGPELVTVDAKERMHSTESHRYAVARDCTFYGLQQLGTWDLPLYYVFGNLGVLTPTEVRSYGTIGPRAVGGGAYYLVPERLAHQFDDVFGQSQYGEAAA